MEEAKAMQPVENMSDQEARIRELTEENELLFEQLHVVQEELEKYYYKLKEYEERAGTATASDANGAVAVVSPKAAAAMAENQKLHALVEQLQAARQVETQNSMAARLGRVLIEGVASTGSLLALPGRLRGMWKELDRKTPPAALGGKTFQKVVDAYAGGRDDAVERLLDGVTISHVMRANAYTALARQLMGSDAKNAASYARRAWESDPRPYRLKWLASRVYEAGDTATAEALLDMLPEDIAMSDSEQRQAMRIRQQAKQARDKKAETESGKAGQEAALQREAQSLRNERDDAQKKLAEQQKATAKYKSDAETQKKEKDAAQREAETFRQQVENGKAEAEGLRGELEQSQRQVAKARAEGESLRKELEQSQQQMADAKAESETLRLQVENGKAEAEGLRGELEQSQRQVADATAESETLRLQVENGKAEAEGLRGELEQSQRQVAKARAEGESLRKELEQSQQQMADAKAESETLRLQVENGKAEAEGLRGELEQSQRQVADATAESETLRLQVENGKAEAEGLRGELEQSQRQVADATARAENMQAARDAVRQIADERQAELERANARHETLQRLYTESFGQAAEQWKTLQAELATQGEALSHGFEQVGKNIVDARSKLEKFSKNELDNVLRQSVAYDGLASFFDSGKLPAIKAWKRGWPASPDFVLHQVELIARNEYDLIIEFGSGYTTLYTAKTLALLEAQGKKVARAVSFDHLEQFQQQTISLLRQEGLEDRVQVIHAPLEEYCAPDGVIYQYYSCWQTLVELAAVFGKDAPRVFVIVDGPPGTTGKNARYPALPIVMKHFHSAKIDFFLDDYRRGDEKEIAKSWIETLNTAGIEHTVAELPLDKDGILLRVRQSEIQVEGA